MNHLPLSRAGVLALGVVAGGVAVAVVVVLLAAVPTHVSGVASTPPRGRPAGGHRSPVRPAACARTVRGVVTGPASVTPGFLPAGFHLTTGNPADLGPVGVAYSSAKPRANGPRVEINVTRYLGPLNASVGGRGNGTTVRIQGRRGLLESGPPGPAFIGAFINAYWKPRPSELVSVTGFRLTKSTVLHVAQFVHATPAGVIPLPISPRTIINRAAAIRTARNAIPLRSAHTAAKLSSWTEVLALIQTSDYRNLTFRVPAVLKATPWRPIWTVMVTGRAGLPYLVVIDAGSGRSELVTREADHANWFGALTDRDPTLQDGCPGGSTSRLPFGVLTRDEELYTLRGLRHLPHNTVIVKLTTVPALNRAAPGLYGGCIMQSCVLDELVWPDIEVSHAPPGRSLPCPPPGAMSPGGGSHKRTKQYFSIDVPKNDQGGCGPLPRWVSRLKDLAPPSRPFEPWSRLPGRIPFPQKSGCPIACDLALHLVSLRAEASFISSWDMFHTVEFVGAALGVNTNAEGGFMK
jgi:hypothetical protein